MSGASRQKKLSQYKVLIRKEVVNEIELTIEARSVEEARDTALESDINPNHPGWKLVNALVTAKPKKVRG